MGVETTRVVALGVLLVPKHLCLKWFCKNIDYLLACSSIDQLQFIFFHMISYEIETSIIVL